MAQYCKMCCLLLLVAFTCCTHTKVSNTNESSISVYKPNISLNNVFQWNKHVKDIKFIPLETNSNSVIGQINKAIIDDSGIFIHDFRNQLLLHFSRDGSFVRGIGEKGKGPNEYLEIRDFCIVADSLYLLDHGKILVYNKATGSFINSWRFSTKKGFNPENLLVFNSSEYYLWSCNPDVWNRKKGSHYQLRKIVNKDIKTEYFKHNTKTNYTTRFYSSGNKMYNLIPTDCGYVINKIAKDSVYADFKIDFGTKAMTVEKFNELAETKKRNVILKSNYFKNISNVLELKDYIYFKCVGPKSRIYEGIINKKSGNVDFGKWDFKRSPVVLSSDGINLYGYYEPASLIKKESNNSIYNNCFRLDCRSVSNVKISDNLILVKIHLKRDE